MLALDLDRILYGGEVDLFVPREEEGSERVPFFTVGEAGDGGIERGEGVFAAHHLEMLSARL